MIVLWWEDVEQRRRRRESKWGTTVFKGEAKAKGSIEGVIFLFFFYRRHRHECFVLTIFNTCFYREWLKRKKEQRRFCPNKLCWSRNMLKNMKVSSQRYTHIYTYKGSFNTKSETWSWYGFVGDSLSRCFRLWCILFYLGCKWVYTL